MGKEKKSNGRSEVLSSSVGRLRVNKQRHDGWSRQHNGGI